MIDNGLLSRLESFIMTDIYPVRDQALISIA
ncbi:MAG: hypothetical protein JWM59_1756 [Verrucomicrobiales bacterium]|nr:hypothetical protein [Verrucomicrobiales bacterium]